MPVRDYECKDCGKRREDVLVLQSEPEPIWCECGGPLARTITAPAGYSIKGNNSSSTTPRRFRGEE